MPGNEKTGWIVWTVGDCLLITWTLRMALLENIASPVPKGVLL